ncbi:uncharacterized protein DUF4225 [Orbus hercynius]|uniref:Uncharacterized protein DUF4225 n=1 Tax=Orbus hercynius TaxID=593135 RepID=A0A495RJ91_9GAMM|nr:DUF4225 domain-containing protein [Orbus hercynius]RKS87439.1 uncharacterized protein DUF4225 [Orbus hercynius]
MLTTLLINVDNGTMTYEQGSEKIKEEEDSLWNQSFQWLTNGLSIFGGVGMVMAGWALCSTGVGCLIGAPLVLHGANSVYEGTVGVASGIANLMDGKNRDLNINGPLRQVYQSSATELGFDASVGTLTYDLVDFGISIRGKLKLVPKLNEFGDPKFKLFFYGRQDLERAYLQMSRKLLGAEIFSDTLSLINVYEDLKKAFVLDSDTQQVSMVISEPEKISNVKDILDDCSLVVTITGNNENTPGYYLCERSDGSQYKRDYSGNITEGGLTH